MASWSLYKIHIDFLAKLYFYSTVHIRITTVAGDYKVNYSFHEARKHTAIKTQLTRPSTFDRHRASERGAGKGPSVASIPSWGEKHGERAVERLA